MASSRHGARSPAAVLAFGLIGMGGVALSGCMTMRERPPAEPQPPQMERGPDGLPLRASPTQPTERSDLEPLDPPAASTPSGEGEG